jgi:hypothetical protein
LSSLTRHNRKHYVQYGRYGTPDREQDASGLLGSRARVRHTWVVFFFLVGPLLLALHLPPPSPPGLRMTSSESTGA